MMFLRASAPFRTSEPEPDVIVIGLGWAGSIIATELALAGHTVLALERGAAIKPTACGRFHPELQGPDASVLGRSLQLPDRGSIQFRSSPDSAFRASAAGIRSFVMGDGVGGAGLLWSGVTPRLPLRGFTTGLEADLDRAERTLGVTAARLADLHPVLANGHDRLEGRGFTSHVLPTAWTSVADTNDFGVLEAPCATHPYALATPLNRVVPAAFATGRLTVRDKAEVLHVLHDGSRATGVRYRRAGELVEARAAAVVVAAWTFPTVALLAASDLPAPAAGISLLGSGLSNHFVVRTEATVESSVATVAGVPEALVIETIDEVGRSIQVTASVAVGPESATLVVQALGESNATLDRRIDIECGDPASSPRIGVSFDWNDDDRLSAASALQVSEQVALAFGATDVRVTLPLPATYSLDRYQSSHFAGGALMGEDPSTSIVDRDFRVWGVDNLWAVGASAFPENPAPNPTLTVVAFAFRAARSVLERLA